MTPPPASPPSLELRLAPLRGRDPAARAFFDEVVSEWRAAGVGAAAPVVGDVFPDFSLPTVDGGYRRLGDLLATGPVVINFSRGRWCPYCSQEIAAWAEALPVLVETGARFIEITGETGGGARALGGVLAAADHAQVADVLCDIDHGVALSLGLAFFAGAPLLAYYRHRGLDLGAYYGSQSGFLPVPGTFALDRDGRVLFAFVDVDFRNRAEPTDVIAALTKA